MTPSQRYRGEDQEILGQRERIYQEAQKQNPERWSPITRDWTPIGKEALNSQNEMVSHDQQLEEEISKEVKQIA